MTNNDYNRYSTAQIAAAFQVSLETVRLWCTEFERHLSPRANPGHRQKRNFSHEDMEILALIAELKNVGMTFSNIHAALENGERGEVPFMLDSDPEESDALVLRGAETRLTQQIQHLQVQMQELKSTNERLEQELNEAQRTSLRHEVRAEFLAEQLEKTEKRIRELLEERSKLEREIGSMESDLRRKDDDE